MKVFISWSGDQGKACAKLFYDWLPGVLQAVKPFYSPDDIAKGTRWASEVGAELDASQVGIIIVTRESLAAPWVMFEAGALSKNVGRAKVVPVLVDLTPSEIRGPLMQFQCARIDDTDIKRLLRMLNSELRDRALPDDVLESVFKMWWPRLEEQVADLLRQVPSAGPVKQPTERDLLEEILGLTRSMLEQESEPVVPFELDTSIERYSGSLTLASVKNRLTAGGNLRGANLMNLNLAREDLSNADLRGANLVRVNLTEATLAGANLDGANLEGAVLDQADLAGANISRVNLWHASMQSVRNLDQVASMDSANLYGVELSETDGEVVARHQTVRLGDYDAFFQHYRNSGMSEAELSDVFLWTAHAYPGEAP